MYNDTPGDSRPIDGTGGVPANISFSANATTPLIGAYDARLIIGAANDKGEGVAYDFTADNAAVYQPVYISFYYTTTSNYATGDITLWIYDKTNGVMIPPSVQAIPSGPASTYFSAFFVPNSNSTSYRFIFHVSTPNAAGYTFEVDQIFVGRINTLTGTAISGWTQFPMLFGGATPPTKGTITTDVAQWRRVGSVMEITYHLVQTANGVAGTGDYIYLLPPGFTIDFSKLETAQGTSLGFTLPFTTHIVTAALELIGQVEALPTTANGLYLEIQAGLLNTTTHQSSTNRGLDTIQEVHFNVSVPIAQWTTNINLVTDFTEYASNSSSTNAGDTTSFVYGNQGATGIIGVTNLTADRKKRVRFTRPIQPTDQLTIELYNLGMWANAIVSPVGNPIVTQYTFKNANGGMDLSTVNSTDIDVIFYQYPYGDNGLGWGSANYNGVKWRVRKISNGNFAEMVKQINAVTDADRSNVLIVNTSTNTAGVWSAAVTMTGVPMGAKAAWCHCSALLGSGGANPVGLFVEAATGYTLSDITSGNNRFKYRGLSNVVTIAGISIQIEGLVRIRLDSSLQFKWCSRTTNTTINIGSAIDWEY